MRLFEISYAVVATFIAKRSYSYSDKDWLYVRVKEQNRLGFNLLVSSLKTQADKYIKETGND